MFKKLILISALILSSCSEDETSDPGEGVINGQSASVYFSGFDADPSGCGSQAVSYNKVRVFSTLETPFVPVLELRKIQDSDGQEIEDLRESRRLLSFELTKIGSRFELILKFFGEAVYEACIQNDFENCISEKSFTVNGTVDYKRKEMRFMNEDGYVIALSRKGVELDNFVPSLAFEMTYNIRRVVSFDEGFSEWLYYNVGEEYQGRITREEADSSSVNNICP